MTPQIKADFRKKAAIIRRTAHEVLAQSAPLLLAAQPFPATPRSGFNRVSAFFPFRSEIDSRPLLGRLAGEGWTTALPVIRGPGLPLGFRRWLPGQPTVKGAMDIESPAETEPEIEPDVLIVPLLAFDKRGFRLGYGGGYYDRTLAMLRAKKKIIAIGAAYSAQQVDSVPHDAHDQPLDYVMTERTVITCG